MKRKTLLLSIVLTCYYAMATAQLSYNFEMGKTSGTHYKLPNFGVSMAYKYDVFTIDAGMKTNWQEYYSLFFLSVGGETKGKFLFGGNFGIGITTCLPQEDRFYQDGQYTYISKGFTTKSICAAYGNVKLGYQVLKIDNVSVKAYTSYSYSYKYSWASIGLRIGFDK